MLQGPDLAHQLRQLIDGNVARSRVDDIGYAIDDLRAGSQGDVELVGIGVSRARLFGLGSR